MEEWLGSAEYILVNGNPDVVLCERGIRTFETATRNTADLAIIPLVRKMTHLPVIFDPSHATGKRDLVLPTALASIVVGAHGVMVEVHPEPGARPVRRPPVAPLQGVRETAGSDEKAGGVRQEEPVR